MTALSAPTGYTNCWFRPRHVRNYPYTAHYGGTE
jgi:hypothetical protein